MDINNVKYSASLFGASGLTGKFLLEHLINDSDYEEIRVFVRNKLDTTSNKVRQIIYNPENLQDISLEIVGDHLFCCIGTTIKKAKSKEAFYKVDHDLVEKIARIGSLNKFRSFVVISSIGANPNSGNFYLRTKGQMEESIKTFNYRNISILRPSMLMGLRKERRVGEEIGKVLFGFVKPLLFGPLKKYKAIHASVVAKAMIILAKRNIQKIEVIESDQIEKLVTN